MTADEVYLWLLPVMAFGAFLLGGYLLVSGRQAKAAGEESNKIKFLGVEIESSTSGTTLIILAIVVVVVVISLGIGRAVDDNGNDDTAGDDESSETETTDDETDDGETDDGSDNGQTGSGLTKEQNVITPADLDAATTGINTTGWAEVTKEERPTLDCLQTRMADLDGFVGPVAARNFKAQDGGPEASAMSTVAKFNDDDAAEEVFDDVREWLQSCPSGLEGNRPFRADRAAARQDFTDNGRPVSWRNFWLPDDVCQCIWVNSQAVGRNGDLIVLLSVDWRQAQVPSDTLGPIPQLMPRALALADD